LKAGIDTCFSTKTTHWLGQCLKMKPPGFWEDTLNLYFSLNSDENEEEHVAEIKESKYEKVDPMEVAQQQKHLDASKCKKLGMMLNKFEKLFDGTLGCYPHKNASGITS
jgi:hypothetical protein